MRQRKDRWGWQAERICRRRNLGSREKRERREGGGENRGDTKGPEARQTPDRQTQEAVKVRYTEGKKSRKLCCKR